MSEVSKLLKHPSPVERAMAIKLSSVTPEDIAVAILDPEPKVFQAAFNHKDAAYALHNLASNTRDAAGNPIFDRHDFLLKDPRVSQDHINLMAGAVKQDATLPIQQAAARLKVLSDHGYQDIAKNESAWAHHLLYAGSLQHPTGKVSRAENETPHEHLKPVKHTYESLLKENKAIEPNNAGLHDIGQISPKVVYNVGEHKLMVKPYEEEDHPTSGWAESTSQHLYHAADLSHLHQQSFVSNHGGGKYNIPATVIKLDPSSVPVHKAALNEARSNNPALEDDARKIAVMDFLTANVDRHSGNLMMQPNGHPLAIDNAIAFGKPGQSLDAISNKPGVASIASSTKTPEGKVAYQKLIKDWWPTVSSDLKRTFQNRINLIQHPVHKERIESAFNSRANWLDSKAKQDNIDSFGDYADQGLNKSMEGAEFLSNHPDTKVEGLHESLMDKHPAAHNAEVERFEKNVNKTGTNIQPSKHDLGGMDVKAVYKHGDKSYLIKPSVMKVGPEQLHTPLSAFNEMNSQAMYHAAGIGHLHQKAHCTVAHGHFPDSHGLVIHMQPGVKRLSEASPAEKEQLKQHPDIKKIGLMDFVTFNNDRHDDNLMIDDKGNPLAIDHSLSGRHDADESAHENQDLWWHTPGDGLGAGFKEACKPDAATWDWWHKNKDVIIKTHKSYLDLIPHKELRDRIKDSFDYRINAIEDGWTPLGQPVSYGEEKLNKTLEGADFLHTQHDNPKLVNKPDLTGVHEKLMAATPDAIKPHRYRFEVGLNKHKDIVKPTLTLAADTTKTRKLGEEPKAFYKKGGHRFMVKPQVGPSTAMSAWNEMSSQAMYHAGNIGHLHQKVHATTLANQPNVDPNKPLNGIVSHLEPDSENLRDAQDNGDPRVGKMVNSPQHRSSLKKMGVMDWLTDNPDRHNGNIVVKPDGSPIGIDHGRSNWSHRHHAMGSESEEEPAMQEWIGKLQKDPHVSKAFFDDFNGDFSDAIKYGGRPDEETWQWWDANKDKIRGAFKKHVDMLPNETIRNKMMNSFDTRLDHLDDIRSAGEDTPPDEYQDVPHGSSSRTGVDIDPTFKHTAGFKPTIKG